MFGLVSCEFDSDFDCDDDHDGGDVFILQTCTTLVVVGHQQAIHADGEVFRCRTSFWQKGGNRRWPRRLGEWGYPDNIRIQCFAMFYSPDNPDETYVMGRLWFIEYIYIHIVLYIEYVCFFYKKTGK